MRRKMQSHRFAYSVLIKRLRTPIAPWSCPELGGEMKFSMPVEMRLVPPSSIEYSSIIAQNIENVRG